MHLFRPKSPRNLIVDVDVGCDDAWALFILLKAMDNGLCNIVAITCTNGNTTVDNVARNVLRVLQVVGRERDIPVYKGAVKELISTKMLDQFHGVDGLSDLQWETEPDVGLIRQEHAVNKMYELVRERPKDISIMCLGPLTNLAIALRLFPEMAEQIKDLYLMGGNNQGVGNTTKAAEFNFYLDSEAVSIVLSTVQCPVTILPWEACIERSIEIPMSWRRDVLAAVESPIIDFLNPVELKAFREFTNYIPCDALVACLFIHPAFALVASEWHVVVELNGQETRGQLVLDHLKEKANNAKIVERVDEDDLKKIMLWTCGAEMIEIVDEE